MDKNSRDDSREAFRVFDKDKKIASSPPLSPVMSWTMHQERFTDKEVGEMIHEADSGRQINYK
uniref:Uncharacterized protein n=1 Tax=Oryza meridionalis TaxID=40149 RepID=A0A0E0C2J3_9ORYZ